MKLKFKCLSGKAKWPVRATAKLAGYDLFSAEKVELRIQGVQTIKTDIALKMPKKYGGIARRSSWAQKFVSVGAGIIVADCRENVYVILFNFSSKYYKIDIRKRIAEIIAEKISSVEFEEVSDLKVHSCRF